MVGIFHRVLKELWELRKEKIGGNYTWCRPNVGNTTYDEQNIDYASSKILLAHDKDQAMPAFKNSDNGFSGSIC